MSPIYGQPVWLLMRDALDDLPEEFTTQGVVEWFATHYPEVSASTASTTLSDLEMSGPPSSPYRADQRCVRRIARGVYTRHHPAGVAV